MRGRRLLRSGFALAPSAIASVAELAGRAQRAEEDKLVGVVVAVVLEEMSLPTTRVVVGAPPTFDADDLTLTHASDDGALTLA